MLTFTPMIATLILLFLQFAPPFERLTIEDGLSQNMVLDLHQDRHGFLWIATKDGLNTYDGRRFKVYRNVPGDSTTLANNVVNQLWEHPDGSIWMVTNGGGLHRMDPRLETFARIRPAEVDSVWEYLRYSNSITGDRWSVWISSPVAGIYRYDVAEGRMSPFLAWNTRHLDAQVKEIRMDGSGNLWIVSAAGFFVHEAATNRLLEDLDNPRLLRANDLHVIDDSTAWGLTYSGYHKFGRRNGRLERLFSLVRNRDLRLNAFASDRNGTLWIGGLDRLFRHDEQASGWTEVAEVDVRLTSAMLVDRSGIVWMGTAGWGLLKYDPNMQAFRSSTGNPFALIHAQALDHVERLFPVNRGDRGGALVETMVDSEGRTWVAADFHNLGVYDPATGQAKRFRAGVGLPALGPNRRFTQIAEFRDGSIWLGGPGGLYRLNERDDELEFHPIRTGRMPNLTGKPDVTALHVDASDVAWVGTPDLGIARYDARSRTVTWYRTPEVEDILSISPDPVEPGRYLWVGTEGGGLNRLDIRTGDVRHFGLAQGLPSMVVYGILSDEQKHLWFSSNNGLSRFNPVDFSIRNFDASYRLQGNEFNRNEYVKLADGRMVFGGVNGFTEFHPADIRVNRTLPEVVLTDFRIFNQPVDRSLWATFERDPIRLEYHQRMITFEFAALEFTAPQRNRYRYRMEGYDRGWIESGFTPSATYTNLPPGSYTFRVLASNNDGLWNETGLAIPLEIRPPFWMTLWFRMLGLFLLIGAFIGAYRWRVGQLRNETQRMEQVSRLLIERQEEERLRFAQEMHDGLGQELLVMKQWVGMWAKQSDPGDTRKNYVDLSDQISSILKSVKNISYNLRPPELDRIGVTETVRYLLQESARAADMDIDMELEDVDRHILPEHHISVLRMFQEMVSNTIRHSKATMIRVSMKVDSQWIRIEFADDGVGFDRKGVDRSTGLGLSGIIERVRILSGTVSIETAAAQGASITISIPVRTQSKG